MLAIYSSKCEAPCLHIRAGLPGNEILFHIVPFDPAYKGLTGHLLAKFSERTS
jgi:hypothetical protein